jgi:multiple sugar transport system permease protein
MMDSSSRYTPYLLILPSLAVLIGLILYPVAYSIWLSLFSKHAYLPVQEFVGLGNYASYLQNPEFWRAVYLGAIFAGGSVTLQIIVGVLAALLLNEEFRGRGLVRAIVLFPYMLPAIVVVLLMRWLLNDTYGVVKNLMVNAGLGNYVVVWFSPDNIMLTLILISVWIYFPFVVMAVLARLQSIDSELYDAARVDGAGVIRRFTNVTLPQIRDVLVVIVLLRVIFMFTKFDLVWLLVGAGGIGYYVRTLPIFTFVTSFGELQVGAGASLSVMMFGFLLVFAITYLRLARDEAES